MNVHEYNKRKPNLKMLSAYPSYTLYIDIEDNSLWFFNGEEFYGIDINDLYKQLFY